LTDLHSKSSEVFIKPRSPAALLLLRGQAKEQTTVKWSISFFIYSNYAWLMLAAVRALVEQQPAEEDYSKFR